MACLDFNKFEELILAFDQKTIINQEKDKRLRYNVWETVADEVKNLTEKLNTSALLNKDQSPRILRKIESSLRRIRESEATGGNIQKDIFNSEFNIEMSIALHEVMESIKGESDKARNLDLEISQVSNTGVLPALPLSRVAASIGRKIAFQKGYRFKKATDADNAAIIESLYYDIGLSAIQELSKAGKGYVTINTDVPTIFDYQNREDLKKDFPKNKLTRSDVMSVSLNEKTLGIKPGTAETGYFLKRSESDLTDTDLGIITEKLRLANLIVQPNTIVLPDTKPDQTDADLKQWDDGIEAPDSKTEKARKALYKKPLFVNNALHSFLQLMNEESLNTGKSATRRINEIFGTKKNMVRSLFGLKRSDDFSIDKKESVAGQNLSKTTPWDDLVEYYDELQVEGSRAPLHLAMKIGRNARLYYLNSVLNPHASKQMRYLLTPGEYTLDTNSADFDFFVHSVASKLKAKDLTLSYDDIVSGDILTEALVNYNKFQSANTLVKKMQALGPLARQFQGVDIVSLLTGLQAVQDIRNPSNGKVTTEFTVSADATASGGTITFMQALGTNPEVTGVLQRIGMLFSKDSLVKQDLDDIYGLMSKAVTDLLEGTSEGFGADIGANDVTEILQDTLNMLFKKSDSENEVDIREFSKDPTMVFIYGQGKRAATTTIARKLADRVIDSLDEADTRAYLSKLFPDKDYTGANPTDLKNEEGLYKAVKEKLVATDLPGELYELMKANIKDEFLSEYSERSDKVYALVKQLPSNIPFKVLPLGAVLDGKKASRPGDLDTYGMPLTKIVEVNNKLEGREDTVLTRREKLTKTVLDVSTTHGFDAGLLYHSLADVSPDSGVAVVHDEVRGTVQTVRAMEKAYVETAIKAAGQYDVHQQVMEAVAAASPEIANSSEFKALKKQIDDQVNEKARIISDLFNRDTDTLIGEGKQFESFATRKPVDNQAETPVQSTIPKGTPLAEQDFGDTTMTITEGDETVEVLAQEYWNNIQSRLDMVEKLKVCLS